jgi:hypothetical protein
MILHAGIFCLALAAPGSTPACPPVGAAVHDIHVSHTRMAIEETAIVARVRLFRDDLERGLRRMPGQAARHLTAGDRADSLFAEYAGRCLVLTSDGTRLTGRVLSSGLERDEAAQDVVWYVLEYRLAHPPSRLAVGNALLFEVFDSQQNVMAVQAQPGDRHFSLYFAAGDPNEQLLTLR